MEDVRVSSITPLPKDSAYVKPFRFNYTQNGKAKNWDLLEAHDSVAAVVFNVTRGVAVLVKQFRPAIYFNSIPRADRVKGTIDETKYPASLGVSLEMCAGIVDKNKPLDVIIQEEILEECGYKVNLSDLQRIVSFRSGVGVHGSLQTLYYCEVTDAMKTGQGGGVENEMIEVVEKTIPELERIMSEPGPLNSPPAFLFAVMWFLRHKAHLFKK